MKTLEERLTALEEKLQKYEFDDSLRQFTLDSWMEELNKFAKTLSDALYSWIDALEEHSGDKGLHRGIKREYKY